MDEGEDKQGNYTGRREGWLTVRKKREEDKDKKHDGDQADDDEQLGQ